MGPGMGVLASESGPGQEATALSAQETEAGRFAPGHFPQSDGPQAHDLWHSGALTWGQAGASTRQQLCLLGPSLPGLGVCSLVAQSRGANGHLQPSPHPELLGQGAAMGAVSEGQ